MGNWKRSLVINPIMKPVEMIFFLLNKHANFFLDSQQTRGNLKIIKLF